MRQRLKAWWGRRFRRPTSPEAILPVCSRVVTLPILSQLARRKVRVRIRIVAETLLSTVFDPRFKGMSEAEVDALLKTLPAEEVRKLDEKNEAAVEILLRMALLDPPLAPVEGPAPPGSIPYEAVHADRFVLTREIAAASWIFAWRSKEATRALALRSVPARPAPQTMAARAESS